MPLVSRRERIMAILAAGSIVMALIGWYRLDPDLPEFDSPNISLVQGWYAGGGGCSVTVNGDRLWAYRGHYKLASGCFIYDGLGDILDAPNLQQSPLYDIRHGSISVMAKWGAGFPQYMEEHHAGGNFVALFLVPIGIATSQFNTLRQARALGVRIVSNNLAKGALAQ